LPILASSFRSITAERKETKNAVASVNIDSTPNITSVKERDITLLEKQPTLQVEFEFETKYSPDLGTMKFVGDIIYSTKDAKTIVKGWDKDKKLPQEVDAEIKNFIFKRCLTLGINMSDQLQLPSPLGFPTIMMKKGDDKKTNYIG
jgi:hypothetical protein